MSSTHLAPSGISEPLVLTVAQAAKALQVSDRHIENLIGSGRLRAVHYGRSKRILADDLRQFAAEGTR